MRFIVIQVLEETRTLGGMQVALQSKIKHLDNKSVSQPIVLIIMVLKKLAKEQTRFDYVPEIGLMLLALKLLATLAKSCSSIRFPPIFRLSIFYMDASRLLQKVLREHSYAAFGRIICWDNHPCFFNSGFGYRRRAWHLTLI